MSHQEFMKHIQEASKETRFLSGGYHRNLHIKEIIDNKDENTVTYACLILEDHVHLAFTILYQLVENGPPIPSYYAGRIPVIKECWKYWALREKLVSISYNPSGYWVEDKNGNKGNWH